MIRFPKFQPGQAVKLNLVPEDFERVDFGASGYAYEPYAARFGSRLGDTYIFLGYIEHAQERCVITNRKNDRDFVILDGSIRALTEEEFVFGDIRK